MKRLSRFFVLFVIATLTFTWVTPAFAATANTPIVNMHEIVSEACEKVESITDSYGNSYTSNVFKLDASNNAYVTFDLNGRFTTFKGSIVCSTDTGSGASMNIGFFADGKLIYGATGITRQQPAKDVELDLTGVGTLEIKTSNSGEFSYGWLFLVSSTFQKADAAEPFIEWARLGDMVVIDSGRGYDHRIALSKDVMGDLHSGAITLDASYETYVLYNLNAQYVKLKGNIITFPETGQGANMTVNIYADDKLVFSKSGITKQASAIPFELDVSGIKVLKFTTSNEGEYSYGRLFVVDDILTKHVHTSGDWKVTKEATCMDNGERVQYCTDCGEVAKTETIAATGHTADGKWVIEKAPTCCEKGKQIQHCSVCGEVADSESIETLEHTPSSSWEVTKDATCKVVGEQVKKCVDCSKVVEKEEIPTTDHAFGDWETISGSIWNNPIVKERICSICGDVEHEENNSTSWLKPLVIVIFIIAIGGVAVICVTLRMNGLPLEIASVKQLFSKETLSDTDIDDILNKPDAPTGKSSDQTEQ